ncbi:unnamed protein product [Adineta steineri]|uniref:RING-type domain-containing protein n=1 Tax=Adineta steineri TaxID=433720 RepID=A0A814PLG6_9BILA|nr:unnamed protein product [Adineta steineri]CAF1376579.1 unnamed protein product [Adineta steineri]
MAGFDCRNKNTMNEKYLCRSCNLLLRDPVQLLCGHRFCQACIDSQQMILDCILCHEKTNKNEMFSDRGVVKDMTKLNIWCFYCQWTGEFKNYENHLMMKHSNRFVNGNVKNNAFSQIRRLIQNVDECRKQFRMMMEMSERILSQTSPDKTSIEEQNAPDERLPQQENCIASHDGTLLWKIDNVLSRLNGNNNSVLTSSPFYTSPSGYKMCARIYLNGNNIDQSTYASIFLILMHDNCNAILKWSFDFQAIFCLYNLNDTKKHIIESFRTDIKSRSFQRPRSEMNIGSGIPKFFSSSVIQQENSPYVCNDSIYIKIMVTENSIPISILPKIMSIDPALPVYIQQEMIQKETENYNMQPYQLKLTLKLRQICNK